MKILKAFCFLLLMFISGAAILAPFVNQWFFNPAVIWTVIIMAYGDKMALWAGGFMEDNTPSTKL